MTADQIKQILPDYRSTGASLIQARFAACYVSNGLDPVQAYKDAYAKPQTRTKTAEAQGYALLRTPEVRTLVQRFTNSWIEGKKETLEPKILKSLMARAFWDPAELFDVNGEPNFESWDAVPEETRMAIDGIELQYYGKDANQSAVRYKMASRQQAIAMLAQYIGITKGNMPQDMDSKTQPIAMTPGALASLQAIYSRQALSLDAKIRNKSDHRPPEEQS